MNRQRAVISKEGAANAIGPGMIVKDPSVGDRLELFLDSGKILLTSVVKAIARHGSELIVDTVNSRYRLVLA